MPHMEDRTYVERDPRIAEAFPFALADNDRNRMVFAAGWRAYMDPHQNRVQRLLEGLIADDELAYINRRDAEATARGVDLALDELVKRDQYSGRTIDILNELARRIRGLDG